MLDDRFANAITAVVALTLVVSVAAAGGGVSLQQDDAQADGQEQTQDTSYLRVAHVSPDAPNVNVTVGNETVATDADYGAVSEYVNVSSGTHNVTISIADETNAVLFEGNVTLEPRTVGTLAVSGEFSTMTQTDIEPVLYQDDAWQPGDETAAVRVAHLSPDAGPVDVVVADGPSTQETATGTDAVGAETETATASEGTATAADDATGTETTAADATETGTDEAGTGTETGTATAGTATATPGEATETAAVGEETTAASGGAEVPTVLADDVSFRNASQYVNVPAGDYTLEIREESPDNDGEVLATVEVSVEGGQVYTVIAGGYAAPDDSPAGEEFGVDTVRDASHTLTLPDRETTANDTDAAGTETDAVGDETATDAAGDETATGTATEGTATDAGDETETEAGEEETETETPAEGTPTATPTATPA